MDVQHQLACGIFGHLQVFHVLWVGAVRGDAEPSSGIVAAGGADRSHEDLLPLVDDVALQRGVGLEFLALAPLAVVQLVEALEHKALVHVLEVGCDLAPDSDNLLLYLLVKSFILGSVLYVLPVVVVVVLVVVHVHYDVLEAGIQGIADHLGHAGHPLGVYLVGRRRAYLGQPRHRNADGRETGFADLLDGLRGHLGVAPYGLDGHQVVAA